MHSALHDAIRPALRVQAWLAYCYMIQDRPDKAKARAVAALRVAERIQPNAGDVASLMSDALGLEEGDEGVAGMRPVTLATLMLIKAHLKLGDASEANDAIARLLEQKPMDDKLLAAVCEEISTMGPTRRGRSKPATYPRPSLCSGRIPWHRMAAPQWPLPRLLARQRGPRNSAGCRGLSLSLDYRRACDGDALAFPLRTGTITLSRRSLSAS